MQRNEVPSREGKIYQTFKIYNPFRYNFHRILKN